MDDSNWRIPWLIAGVIITALLMAAIVVQPYEWWLYPVLGFVVVETASDALAVCKGER